MFLSTAVMLHIELNTPFHNVILLQVYYYKCTKQRLIGLTVFDTFYIELQQYYCQFQITVKHLIFACT